MGVVYKGTASRSVEVGVVYKSVQVFFFYILFELKVLQPPTLRQGSAPLTKPKNRTKTQHSFLLLNTLSIVLYTTQISMYQTLVLICY